MRARERQLRAIHEEMFEAPGQPNVINVAKRVYGQARSKECRRVVRVTNDLRQARAVVDLIRWLTRPAHA